MSDTFTVTPSRQFVFHDGTSMIVCNKGKRLKVNREQAERLIAEGVINAPKGFAKDDEPATEPATIVSDSGGQTAPADAPPA